MPTLRESIQIDEKRFDRSIERIVAAEEQRASNAGFGTTKQVGALFHKYTPPLAAIIEEDRPTWRKHKTLALALKGKEIEDIADDMLFAGFTVGNSPRAYYGHDAWEIGRIMGYQRRTTLEVGVWAIEMLLKLPIFVLENGVLLLKKSDEIDILLTDVIRDAAVRRPLLVPFGAPPAPWTQVDKGVTPPGFWARPLLVNHHPQILQAWRKAISTGQMSKVLDALNFMQSVPFTINRPVLSLLSRRRPVWHHVRHVPQDEIEEWKTTRLDLTTAIVLVESSFYVPLRLDYRGRVNPIPMFSFTRGDEIRGLFLFANGAPIGEEGLRWLKAHVAGQADGNTWSTNPKPSKLDFDPRIAWTDANIARLTDIGRALLDDAPLARDDLPGDDESPYQFAAACVELVQALDAGPDYITRLPLTFDGSCSCLQHLCAMTRAEEGRHANLTADEEAHDFYGLIAAKVYEACRDLNLMRGPDDRAIVKQPAMTFFYGSRAGGWQTSRGRVEPKGMTKQVVKALKKRDEQATTKGAEILARAAYAAVKGTVPGAVEVRDFLEALCRACSKQGRPLSWTTPLGLPVINLYYKPHEKNYSVQRNGRRIRIKRIVGDTDQVNGRKAATAVTANFVHSCDAAHLHLIALAAKSERIDMVSVHDSFGCIAPNAKRFNEIIREQFHSLYTEHDLLEAVSLPKGVTSPARPQMGTLDLRQVLNSYHAFK